MNRFMSIAFVGALTVTASAANAQDRHVAIEAATGISLPAGVFADRYEAGVHVGVGVELRHSGSRVGWRVEGTWDDFSPKYGGRDNHQRAGGLTANGILSLTPPRLTAVALYAIGGVGYYNTREMVVSGGTQSNIGWDGGGGLRFPIGRAWFYLEGRFHDIPTAEMHYAPLTLGFGF